MLNVDVNEELEEMQEERGNTIAAAPPVPDELKTKDPNVWAKWMNYWLTTEEGKEWTTRREEFEKEQVGRVQALMDAHKGRDPVFDALASAPPFPPGYNKATKPPSGFVDEPDVYEEVNYSPEKLKERAIKDSVEKQIQTSERAKENPTAENQLLDNGDAMFWATEFIRIRNERLEQTKGKVDIAEDAGTMVGWFANAFARGEWNSPHYEKYVDELFKELGIREQD